MGIRTACRKRAIVEKFRTRPETGHSVTARCVCPNCTVINKLRISSPPITKYAHAPATHRRDRAVIGYTHAVCANSDGGAIRRRRNIENPALLDQSGFPDAQGFGNRIGDTARNGKICGLRRMTR